MDLDLSEAVFTLRDPWRLRLCADQEPSTVDASNLACQYSPRRASLTRHLAY